MNLVFLTPLFGLGVLAAIPLLAHLLARARPRQREFASIRFLREAMLRVTRVRKPKDRWLLLLRTLAMLALIAAFLQPLLRSYPQPAGKGERTMVIVLDATASMAYADGRQSRFLQATAAADAALATLPAGARANIVWLRSQAESVLPEPGPNIGYLRQHLRTARLGTEAGSVQTALSLAIQQLASSEGSPELVVCSDFQAKQWAHVDLAVPPPIRLSRIAIGEPGGINLGLTDLAVEPARPLANRPCVVTCRVRNFSEGNRRATVYLQAGEIRMSKDVELTSFSDGLAAFPFQIPTAGLVPIKVTLGEDRFPGDNVRHLIAEVRADRRGVVMSDTQDVTGMIWLRALRALDGFSATPAPLNATGANLTKADVLWISGWKGQGLDALKAHLQTGASLVIRPDPAGLSMDSISELLGMANDPARPRGAGESLKTEVHDTGWPMRLIDDSHPALQLFASGISGDPAAGRVRLRSRGPDFGTAARTLLAFEDGAPAVLAMEPTATRPGTVIWWCADLTGSDWPERSAFVAFMGELGNYLHSRVRSGPPREVLPETKLRFDASVEIDPKDVQLLSDTDTAIELTADPRSPDRLMTTAPMGPGGYRWTANGSVLDAVTINFPDSESDIRIMVGLMKDGGAASISGGSRDQVQALMEGRPIWPWCVGVAACALLMEGLLAWQFQRRSTSRPEVHTTA